MIRRTSMIIVTSLIFSADDHDPPVEVDQARPAERAGKMTLRHMSCASLIVSGVVHQRRTELRRTRLGFIVQH